MKKEYDELKALEEEKAKKKKEDEDKGVINIPVFLADDDGKKKEEVKEPSSNDPKYDILKEYDFIDRIVGKGHKSFIV